jgi:hypothetical protein
MMWLGMNKSKAMIAEKGPAMEPICETGEVASGTIGGGGDNLDLRPKRRQGREECDAAENNAAVRGSPRGAPWVNRVTMSLCFLLGSVRIEPQSDLRSRAASPASRPEPFACLTVN